MFKFLRYHATRLTALLVIGALYWSAQLPVLSYADAAALSSRFAFTHLPLPALPVYPQRATVPVHPDLARISAWMTSVGAAVALWDLDHDGLANDLCWVEPQIGQALVMPAPGTGDRYAPFALDPAPLPFDDATTEIMGCLPGDFNEDGLTDLLLYYYGRTPVIFLHKRLDATPTAPAMAAYHAYELTTGGEIWNTSVATQADLDGDGHLDLVLGNYVGDGQRVYDPQATTPVYMHRSFSNAYNGGRNRVFRWVDATSGAEPTVAYTEHADLFPAEASQGWILALGAADLDGDLLPELYFANDHGRDWLFHNRSTPGQLRFAPLHGEKTFTTPTSRVLGRDSFHGMGVDFGDVNQDGWLDLFVSNITANYGLQESHFLFVSTGEVARMQQGVAPYVEQSEALGVARAGWGWETRFGDFDNDSVLEALQATGFIRGTVNRWPELQELAFGNDELIPLLDLWPRFQASDDLSGAEHNPFYVRHSDGRYYDVAADVGLGEAQMTRGIATADIDGDGDLDFLYANQWESSHLYRNECSACGAFLGLHLRLPVPTTPVNDKAAVNVTPGHPVETTPGRPAIGASATLSLALADGSTRRLTAQVDGGNGHSGKRSPDLHFGLGQPLDPNARYQVELHWRAPDGQPQTQTLTLPAGWHTVMLGAAE